jgi:glycosyltransferase involved in cell wall biosynthesis
MAETVGIVTPAFRAERWISGCVRSVIAQTCTDWQHWIISDDRVDYQALLARDGIRDPRLRFASTGQIGSGASNARNVGLEALDTPYGATLDADDRFKPEKLERAVAALADHALVSMAIDERDEAGRGLRLVGAGPDRLLRASTYKWTCLSMDSMIVWDRRQTDGRYDRDLPNMNDLDFLLRLFRTVPATRHIGTPLHDYLKLSASLSNGEGVTARMLAAKRTILARLEAGFYPMADPGGAEGMAKFIRISLRAEESYPAALASAPGLLFEDHLEPLLRAASTSAT